MRLYNRPQHLSIPTGSRTQCTALCGSPIFNVVTAFDSPSTNASMTSCTSSHLNSGPVPDFEFRTKLERSRAGFLSSCPPNLGYCAPPPDEATHGGQERAILSTWFLVWLYQNTGASSLLFHSRLSVHAQCPHRRLGRQEYFSP